MFPPKGEQKLNIHSEFLATAAGRREMGLAFPPETALGTAI
jgi:hypothetical protein